MFGTTLRLPREFLMSRSPDTLTIQTNATRPSKYTRNLSCLQQRQVFVPTEHETSSHVFIRVDSVHKLLQQPYEGAFRVTSRHDKIFKVDGSFVSKQLALVVSKSHTLIITYCIIVWDSVLTLDGFLTTIPCHARACYDYGWRQCHTLKLAVHLHNCPGMKLQSHVLVERLSDKHVFATEPSTIL